MLIITYAESRSGRRSLDRKSNITSLSFVGGMCESSVFCKDKNGVRSVLTDAVKVRREGSSYICTDIVGRSVTLDNVILSEVDLMRHRIFFEEM